VPDDQPVPLMSERRTALIGGALVAIGPVSMALYTPAMPTLVQVFDTTPALIKLTLTTYIAGFAVAQLVCGPLSDAFGRKRVSLIFLAIYAVASLAAYFAPTIEWMLVARAAQGVGAAVGVATGRAIVRDQYVGQRSARIMNGIAMTLAIGPAVAPTIGALLLTLLGWQAIFAFMALLALPIAAMTTLAMAETNVRPDVRAIEPAALMRNYTALLADARFMRPALVMALTIGLFYTLASILPFVLIDEVGITPSQYGFAMILQSGAFILGTIVASRLLRRHDAALLVGPGFAVMLAAAALLAGILPMLGPSLVSVMAPVGLLAFGIALAIPHMSTIAIAPFPKSAGTAAAMMGFLQMAAGLGGTLLAALLAHPLLSLSVVVPLMPLIALGAYLVLRRPVERTF
jgi:MFS transporter, DHA1 family, multidrug resistance protein